MGRRGSPPGVRFGLTDATGIERLDWVRGHLARIDRHGLTAAERKELLRLLKLIQDDVASLMAALRDQF